MNQLSNIASQCPICNDSGHLPLLHPYGGFSAPCPLCTGPKSPYVEVLRFQLIVIGIIIVALLAVALFGLAPEKWRVPLM